MIMLDEKEYVMNMIEQNKVSNKPSETISMMIKYHKGENVIKDNVYDIINEYMLKNYKYYNKTKWKDMIERYIDDIYEKDYKLVQIKYIPVSSSELDKIKSIQNKRLERLMFTMLVIAKYYNIINVNNNSWVNLKDKEIFKIANFNIPTKTQCLLINDLYSQKLIEYSKKVDNVNNRVTFIDNKDETIEVNDLRDLGYFYDKYMGYTKLKQCEVCGKMFKASNNKNKYCTTCAKSIKNEQNKSYYSNLGK